MNSRKYTELCAFVISCLILFGSCDNPVEPAIRSDKNNIVGSWIWVRSSGGIAGQTLTPASTGQTKRRIFYAGGKAVHFVNAKEREYSYRLGMDQTIFSVDSLPVMYLDNRLRYRYSFPDNNTLSLDENCYDCFGHEYRRR